jgi:apolipoprotein N-acyltransferase
MRMGILFAFVFFLIGIYFIYNKIINDVPIGFSAIIVSIFFISGIVLIALGIIAEYLRKIWEHQQGREFIVINEICEGNKLC